MVAFEPELYLDCNSHDRLGDHYDCCLDDFAASFPSFDLVGSTFLIAIITQNTMVSLRANISKFSLRCSAIECCTNGGKIFFFSIDRMFINDLLNKISFQVVKSFLAT